MFDFKVDEETKEKALKLTARVEELQNKYPDLFEIIYPIMAKLADISIGLVQISKAVEHLFEDHQCRHNHDNEVKH